MGQGTLFATMGLAVTGLLLLVAQAVQSGPPAAEGLPPVLPEPPMAARFVSAYARLDAEGIARSASPLYRSELARRGDAGREAFLPVPWDEHLPPPVTPWLAFRYLDGIVDAQEFAHVFYLAHSRVDARPSSTATLWRVDLDPAGRVIWGEMVFALGEADRAAASRTGSVRLATLPPVPVPRALVPPWPNLRPTTLLAIHSTAGQSYYVLGLVPGAVPARSRPLPSVLVYFGVDPEGQVFPGAWSYGEPTYRWTDSLHAEPVDPAPVATDDEPLREEYVATLW